MRGGGRRREGGNAAEKMIVKFERANVDAVVHPKTGRDTVRMLTVTVEDVS